MPDLKAPSPKFKTALGSRKTSSRADTSSVTEITIRPRPILRFGRRLSFSVDNISIQMSAVSHLGWKKRILDLKKVYIPNHLADASARCDFIAQTIDEFFSEFGRRGAQVAVTISGKETAFRTFFMPPLRKRELDSAVRFEAKKQVPFPLEDSIFGYRPVYKVVGGQKVRYKVALQACTKRLVKETLEPFRQKNISITEVHLAQDVIGQLLKHLPDFQETTLYTVINIDRSYSEISFYRGSNLEFFHVGPIGSSLLGQRPDKGHFEDIAETLSKEIQTSLDYYSGQVPESSAERILVYGDLSYSQELLQFLNTHTGVEFVLFPTEQLDFILRQKERFAEVLPVCLPALASSVCDVRLANLLPEADHLNQARRKVDRLGWACLIFLTVILVAGWMAMKQNTATARVNLASRNKQVASFKTSEAYRTYNMLKRQIASYRAYINKAKRQPSYLNLDLKELSLLTPPTIRLFNLTYDRENPGRNLIIQGFVTSREIPPEILLAEYVENLSGSSFFENVSLIRYVKRRLTDSFEIEFQISMRGIV